MDDRISRRGFLKLAGQAGATAGLAYLGGACRGPMRTVPNPEFLKVPRSTKDGDVLLGLYRRRDFRAICEQVIPKVTDLKWLTRGDTVLIKIACNSPNRHPAVTSPGALSALVGFFRDRGAKKVIVADQAGVEHVRLTKTKRVRSTQEMMVKNGLLHAVQLSGAELHCFDDQGWEGYFPAKADFPNVWEEKCYLPKIVREVDHIVYLPRLSAHALCGYTCGIKIAVGWLRDDSRQFLHQKGKKFFEKIAEINHFPEIRKKLRFSLNLGQQALLNIGPDIGSKYDFGGALALGSKSLVDSDYLASQLVPFFDSQQTSVFDLYAPYPRHADFWNRRLVGMTWGGGAASSKHYEPIITYRLGQGIQYDTLISHLAQLQRYRPGKIRVARTGDPLPSRLVSHLAKVGEGIFAVG